MFAHLDGKQVDIIPTCLLSKQAYMYIFQDRRYSQVHDVQDNPMYYCSLNKLSMYMYLLIKLVKFSCRESLMKDLESNLQQKKDDITRFEEERTDLIAKV